MVLQETYELEDLWYYDPCTSDKGYWSNNNILSFNTDGVCVIGNDSNVSFLDITYPQNYSIECTLTEPNGQNGWTGGLRCSNLGLVGERNKKYYQIISPYSYTSDNSNFALNDKIKIVVENGTAKLYYNDVEKKSTSTTSDKFELLGSPSNNYYMRIKDIKIKAL